MEKRKLAARLMLYWGGGWEMDSQAQTVDVVREPNGTFTLECSGKRLESIWDRRTVPEILPNALRYAAEIVLATASHILEAEEQAEVKV